MIIRFLNSFYIVASNQPLLKNKTDIYDSYSVLQLSAFPLDYNLPIVQVVQHPTGQGLFGSSRPSGGKQSANSVLKSDAFVRYAFLISQSVSGTSPDNLFLLRSNSVILGRLPIDTSGMVPGNNKLGRNGC